jgi:hypothetical protein
MLLGQAGEKKNKQNGFTIKIKKHEHHWQINEGRTNQHVAERQTGSELFRGGK